MGNAPQPKEAAIQAQQAREKAAKEGAEAEATEKAAGKARGPYKKSKLVKPNETPDAKVKIYRAAGRQVADTLILAGMTLGGKDWEPVLAKDEKGETLYDERASLRLAWEDFAEEYQWERMPAWVGVSLATAAYVGPRLTAPSTLSRLDKLKLWWESRKMAKRNKEAAKEKAPEGQAANA